MLEHSVFFRCTALIRQLFLSFCSYVIGYTYIYILSSTIDYHFVRCNSIFSQYSYISSRIYTRCLYAYMNIYIYERVCFHSATVLKPWYVNESFAYETRARVSPFFFVILSLKESWCFFMYFEPIPSIVWNIEKYRNDIEKYRNDIEKYRNQSPENHSHWLYNTINLCEITRELQPLTYRTISVIEIPPTMVILNLRRINSYSCV